MPERFGETFKQMTAACHAYHAAEEVPSFYVVALGAKRRAVVYMTAGRVEWVDDADLGRLPFCAPDRGNPRMPSEDSR